MGLSKQNKMIIEDFNMSDDYRILNILASTKISNEEKRILIDNCQERINKMEREILLQTLRCLDLSFCNSCKHFIQTIISSLSTKEVESLLYQNKHYHDISLIAEFLMSEDWFKSATENKTFILAYELEKALNEDNVDQYVTINMGIAIINMLTLVNTNPELFDMIMKNYITLLERHNEDFLEQFKIYGYEVMDKYLENSQEITPNLLIFDCEIMRFNNQTNVSYFEFYDSTDKQNSDNFAYAYAGVVRINVDAIKDIYASQKNKIIATGWILKVIGHEIDHVFCQRYQIGEKRDLYTELKVYNSRISEALQSIVKREFYLEWHDNFTHEFQANIAGIKSVYERYKYLKSIKEEDKFEINRLFAKILLSSFCEIDSSTNRGYFAAIEFTRDEFAKYIDDLPSYAYHVMFNKEVNMPSELQELENNLTEMDRFMLGYHNRYMGIIELIAKGEIKTTNIFEDLPTLYEQHKDLIQDKFPPFIKRGNDAKKFN